MKSNTIGSKEKAEAVRAVELELEELRCEERRNRTMTDYLLTQLEANNRKQLELERKLRQVRAEAEEE